MFKITTTGDRIKAMFTVAGVCKDTIQLKFNPEGLDFFSMDKSKSAMILGSVKKENFTSFEADECTVLLDDTAFSTPLKRLKKNEAYMSFDNDGIILLREKNTKWTIQTLGGDSVRMPDPKFETGIALQMPVSTFVEEMERIFDGGEVITLTASSDFLKISGGSFDKDDIVSALIPKDQFTMFRFEPVDGVERATAHFNMSFLKDALSIVPKDFLLEIQFDDNKPIRIKFWNEKGTEAYVFILAPYNISD